jgi:broad specificity phosphatase PhoE
MKKILRLLLTIVLLGASVAIADAQQVIILVRHTVQAGPGTGDPPLTEAGERRAERLAGVLKDTGIDVIFVSKRIRTAQTAKPVAKALNVKVKGHSRKDIDGLFARLHAEHAHDRVLIVSHSRRIPRLLKALGHPVKIKIAPLEYDNLFMIVPKSDGDPLVLRLRY